MAWADLHPGFRQVVERAELTRAEMEVVALVADGFGLKAIARRLGVDRKTVQQAWRRAERKIQHEIALMRGYGNGV